MEHKGQVWHACLLFSGGLLVLPPLLGVLQVSGTLGGAISPIHATVLGGMVALLLSAVLSLRGWDLHSWRFAVPVAYGLIGVGMLAFALSVYGIGSGGPLLIAAGFSVGMGKALAFLLWAQLFSCLALPGLLAHSSAAGLIAGVLAWTLMGLDIEWAATAAVFLPGVVGAAYIYGRGALGIADASHEEVDDVPFLCRLRLPWRPVIIMAFGGFIAAWGPIATFGIPVTLEAVAFLPVGACTLGALLFVRSFRSEFLLKASFAVCGLGFLLVLAQVASAMFAGFLVSMSYWGLSLFVFWFLCDCVRERGMASEWVFGVSFALLDAMLFIGYMLPKMGLAVPSAQEGGALGAFVIAALALVVAAAALWAAEHAGRTHWTRQAVSASFMEEAAQSLGDEGDDLVARCRWVGRRRGLTLREEEILTLLLERNTVDQIAHRLFVSSNTVKTHVKHIYAKLGVHNRDELRDMVLGL